MPVNSAVISTIVVERAPIASIWRSVSSAGKRRRAARARWPPPAARSGRARRPRSSTHSPSRASPPCASRRSRAHGGPPAGCDRGEREAADPRVEVPLGGLEVVPRRPPGSRSAQPAATSVTVLIAHRPPLEPGVEGLRPGGATRDRAPDPPGAACAPGFRSSGGAPDRGLARLVVRSASAGSSSPSRRGGRRAPRPPDRTASQAGPGRPESDSPLAGCASPRSPRPDRAHSPRSASAARARARPGKRSAQRAAARARAHRRTGGGSSGVEATATDVPTRSPPQS